MKQIIIFGATGNTGAYLTDYCQRHFFNKGEYQVIAVGRKKTAFFAARGIRYEQVDIRNKDAFGVLPTRNVYAVVNMAGVLPAYLSSDDITPYVDTNIIGGLNILEYARKCHADRVLYTQTWAEQAGYWGKSEVLSPSMPRRLLFTGDHAFYAIAKSMIVDSMQYYWQEHGIRSFVFRLPNIYMYSPIKEYYVDGRLRKVAYRYMIERAESGEPIEMWGDPNAFKDIVYVKDLCQMMFKALLSENDGGVYHVGTGVKTTLRQQIEGIIRVFSPADKPSYIVACPEKGSFPSFVMDIENARRDLGYEPEYSYMDYLRDYQKEKEQKRFDALWK